MICIGKQFFSQLNHMHDLAQRFILKLEVGMCLRRKHRKGRVGVLLWNFSDNEKHIYLIFVPS